VIHVLAKETADGARTLFTSPSPGALTPTVNGRCRTVDFIVLDARTVQLAEAPGYGDVVGFFVETV
jgi:hypothetical protein